MALSKDDILNAVADMSVMDVVELVEAMESDGVSFVFREPQFSARVVQQVADETGAEIRVIYSQFAGDLVTYVDLLRANAAALSE